MKKYYMAASADTKTMTAAFAYKEEAARNFITKKYTNCAAPKALLEATFNLLENSAAESFTIITNSDYLIDAIWDRIYGWEAAGWVKPDGNPVANKDVLEKIYKLLTTKYNDIILNLRHPETNDEKRAFQVVVGVAKATRK